ncbi:SirB1 family protein [Verminephrobacter eiseniae]|uniref:SirB1 family protein n=1 Tax=Verminephrobacter eiseniae TaxID=364317 RepID=UPI002238CB1E|nr:tetratricopeptide repeat protein [Verminephrobacter eiseniae]MCW5234533.1 transglutaminase [Verminephrobacter eiseniae]MCW5293890.1 transglutaminase [Verminephrobacter eiseniae]MCW8185721.1 transglutaminase [Verminephrobacter eiseniae]MCW8222182.1 transglutaminase [Verminephrobacter eiseniae]MCW8235175.1 transglutaminase [Verminephrobacter eiseniae]
MSLRYRLPTSLEYFASLVQSDAHFPLLEAAASLAQDEYPELDMQQLLSEMDQLLARIQRRLPTDAPALQRLHMLNQFFFGDLGFAGNINNYYDPENSYLNAVLRTRRGIPISLAVLWLELAQGLDLQARGVAFPGHFMVKVRLPRGQVVLDPISGQSLSREALAERLEPYQRRIGLVDDYDMPLGLYLQAASPREIIARMLRNLKEVHRMQRDWQGLIAVLDRLVVLLPDAWEERRDRGLAHAERGNRAQAVADLQTYLAHAEDGPDAALMADRLHALRGDNG